MDLLPESRAALDEYIDFAQPELGEAIMTLADTAARVVPEVVALSLCLIDEGITFTVEDPRLPDRPFEVGPAAVGERLSEPHHDLLDEQGWQVRARASSARGIASSISLPVMSGRRVVWAITVYASTPNAFEGRHHALAEALGAWDAGAVTNADLTFRTRADAALAPRQLHDQRLVEVAVGIYAGRYHLAVADARRQLELLAQESGLSLVAAAQEVVEGRHIR